ncbi:MAG: zf-HC2 domain-containing protein [Pyrinomonadaceae bacterium]
MNKNKNIEKVCVHGEEIVSYLYDEMPASGRKLFESHLLECSDCTDDFAGLSLARLNVYEWNNNEFAAMQTPTILIPYENSDRDSWFQSWFGPIFSAPKLAAGGILAAAAIVFGFVLFPSGNLENNISINEVKTAHPTATMPDKPSTPMVAEDQQLVEVKIPNLLNRNDNSGVTAKPIMVSKPFAKKRKIDERVAAVKMTPKTKNIQPLTPLNAPRLTNFEDEDDNTLRLTDLIADSNTDK